MSDQAKEKFSDIFHRNTTYPTAGSIFSFKPKSIPEIKDDCIIVLDTNSLLVPFTTGKDSLDAIENIYKDLVGKKRLIIPGQVAREFAEHRVSKLVDLYQQISNLREAAKQLDLGNYPLLENLPAYQNARTAIKAANKSIREYKETLNDVLSEISKWYWNDPVSTLYRRLFSSDVVMELEIDKDEITKRINRNSEFKLPPGYKDKGKQDEGVGDYIIWYTILKIATDSKKSVIFVSLDEKTDWMIKSAGQALYVRYELIDEFCRVSGGQSFHIMKFSEFLNLYGAPKDVVKEVQNEESQIPIYTDQPLDHLLSDISSQMETEIRRFLAEVGRLDRYTREFPTDISQLIRYGFKEITLALEFDALCNAYYAGRYISEKGIRQAIDDGIRVLQSIQNLFHEIHLVHAVVPIYADPTCNIPIEGVKGEILETRRHPSGVVAGYKIFPTTMPVNKQGVRVSWEWNNRQSFGEFWYRDPNTNEIRHFNGTSNEFVGRDLNEI